MEFHLTATGRHLPYGITQCYLPPDTSERVPPSPQPVSRYSIYLPRRDERLSWPRLPGNAPAGNRTRDLSITSPTPYHYTNRATEKKWLKWCDLIIWCLLSHLNQLRIFRAFVPVENFEASSGYRVAFCLTFMPGSDSSVPSFCYSVVVTMLD